MIRSVKLVCFLLVLSVIVGVFSLHPELVEGAEASAPTAIITVNSTLDNIAFDDQCTLREAIENAEFNNLAGSPDCLAGVGDDTIIFDFGGLPTTITVGSQIDLQSPLTIDGAGEAITIVSTHANEPTFFVDAPGEAVTLREFTITDANTASLGSAIATPFRTQLPHNNLFLDQMILRDNYGQNGGAILAGFRTTLDITNSQFLDNNAIVDGGAIASYRSNIIRIRNTTFRGNVVAFSGGGVGGAISQNNTSQSVGSLEITNSVFDNNRAEGDSEGPGSLASGGAIYNSGRSFITIVGSTFSSNRAQVGGAIHSFLTNSLAIANSTFSGNSAEIQAGGLWLNQSSASIAYSTFYSNSARASGQAIWLEDNPSGVYMVANIVSKGPGISFVFDSCARSVAAGDSNPITSGGGNRVNGCADQLTHPTDLQTGSLAGIDSFLADNGGIPAPITPPQTHAINSTSSPAYNADLSCNSAKDQRSADRSNPSCDAGSFEFGSVPTAVGISKQAVTSANAIFVLLTAISLTIAAPLLCRSASTKRSLTQRS